MCVCVRCMQFGVDSENLSLEIILNYCLVLIEILTLRTQEGLQQAYNTPSPHVYIPHQAWLMPMAADVWLPTPRYNYLIIIIYNSFQLRLHCIVCIRSFNFQVPSYSFFINISWIYQKYILFLLLMITMQMENTFVLYIQITLHSTFFHQTDPGSISGRPVSSEDSSQRAKDADMFKPANTWTNEERNLSV